MPGLVYRVIQILYAGEQLVIANSDLLEDCYVFSEVSLKSEDADLHTEISGTR